MITKVNVNFVDTDVLNVKITKINVKYVLLTEMPTPSQIVNVHIDTIILKESHTVTSVTSDVLLVKEILITVPFVLKTEPISHTVILVQMECTMTNIPLNVNHVLITTHSVPDVTMKNVEIVPSKEVVKTVNVSTVGSMSSKMVIIP